MTKRHARAVFAAAHPVADPGEYVVVYTGALDVLKARAQQRPAPMRTGDHPTRIVRSAFVPIVLGLLDAKPDRWWTFAELVAAARATEGVVRGAVRVLALQGLAESVVMPEKRVGGAYRLVRAARAAGGVTASRLV